MEDARDYRPILVSDRYVLGETDDGFAIWVRTGGPSPVATFDPSEAGFELAEARYDELRRGAARSRLVPHLLLWIVVVGAVLWTIAGTWLGWAAFTASPGELLPRLDTLGFRLLISATLVLAAVRLARGLTGSRDAGTDARPTGEPFARWILFLGLATWAGATIAGAILLPDTFEVGIPGPPKLYFTLERIGSVAFRVWLGAALVLATMWAPRLARRG